MQKIRKFSLGGKKNAVKSGSPRTCHLSLSLGNDAGAAGNRNP